MIGPPDSRQDQTAIKPETAPASGKLCSHTYALHTTRHKLHHRETPAPMINKPKQKRERETTDRRNGGMSKMQEGRAR
ncbi:hypothetical protein KC19_1G149400 [Ceratodon purpureus]|uniref:Uncharacterized protein n=1 Tax=Ceratodon purpureus TaxID=3225 RepID=A0A8T0J7Z7_CERPU|nr:hypothetical protein KC19_1G149400 [Ceratodon purpureus]